MTSILLAPVRRRAWAELLYTIVGLPLAIIGFWGSLAFLGAGLLLSITLVGLPLIVLELTAVRSFGGVHRWLAGRLLGERIDAPAPVRQRRRGYFGWLQARLGDPVAWRAMAYLLLRGPVAVLAAAAAIFCWAWGGISIIYPALWSMNLDRPAPSFGSFTFDRFPLVLVLTPFGLIMVLIAPWVIHGLLWLDRLLLRWLLSPSEGEQRVRDLERSRASAVDDSAATLRRIERDLHDGAQARLVALGMNLAVLRESLDREPPERLREMVDTAAATAKQAIGELRDLVRGIHPPVLDQGLDVALSTVASASAIPVRLSVDVAQRPSAAIETIAYFCVAELITNAGRHSGANEITVTVTRPGDLRLVVADDGRGGATVGAGSGLAGLVERVRTVDGELTVLSPPGGPTVVTVELPAHA